MDLMFMHFNGLGKVNVCIYVYIKDKSGTPMQGIYMCVHI